MDIHSLDREISRIERSLKLLSYIKPINMALERSLFLRGKRRNPIFRYRPLKFSALKLAHQLKNLKTDGSTLGMLMEKKIQELTKKLMLLEHRGKTSFSVLSESLYGTPTEELEQDAYKVLDCRPIEKSKQKMFDTLEIKDTLENILRAYGLIHWHVQIKDTLVTSIAPGKHRVLFLRRGVRFTNERLKRIIAHEIETHILTAENGKYQPSKLFQRGFANYLETQEGMAIFSHECQTKYFPQISRRIGYLTLAIIYASMNSFREAYERMRALNLSRENAFQMVMRAKRGLIDTSEKGAFTKDLIYLKGFRRIEKFVKKGGDLKKLYIGKVALEDLSFITAIPGIVPPRYLPKWLRED